MWYTNKAIVRKHFLLICSKWVTWFNNFKESPWKNGLGKFSYTQNILIAISVLFISFMVKIYYTYGESDYYS